MDQSDCGSCDEDEFLCESSDENQSKKRSRAVIDDKFEKHLQRELFECKAMVDGWSHVLVCMELDVIREDDVKMCIESFIDAVASKMARIEKELACLGSHSRKR